MNSMQLKSDLSNVPSKMCFYKDLLFHDFPKGGTSRRPLVFIFHLKKTQSTCVITTGGMPRETQLGWDKSLLVNSNILDNPFLRS